MAHQSNLTLLLQEASNGNRPAMDRVIAAVYDELRVVARRHRAGEGRDHTLDTTGIVNEAYLKLVDLDRLQWKNRAQFFAIASRAMRQILIDYARRRRAEKRGGDAPVLSLTEAASVEAQQGDELIELDLALHKLEELSERQAQVVECRFFGGLNIEDTAEALAISTATVKREWALARAWLNRELVSKETH